MLFRFLSFAAVAGLVACTTLNKIGYDRPANVESSRSAEVTLVSGAISGDQFVSPLFIGVFAVPIPRSPPKEVMFNVDDQRVFVASLVDELNRLKILHAHDASDANRGEADVLIQVAFLRTHVRDTATNTYTLEVTLQMCARERCTTEQYEVNSSDGESASSRPSFTIVGAKERVAKKLLAKVILGIETFVSQN